MYDPVTASDRDTGLASMGRCAGSIAACRAGCGHWDRRGQGLEHHGPARSAHLPRRGARDRRRHVLRLSGSELRVGLRVLRRSRRSCSRPSDRFPVHVLEFGWTILSATSWLAVMACLWRRSVHDRAPRWARDHPATTVTAVWLLSLLSAPLWLTLNQGQVGIFLWVALTADVLLTIDKRRGAGVLTGLAAATKVLPLIAIPLTRSVVALDAARATLTLVGATLLGVILLPSESRRYWSDCCGAHGSASEATQERLTGRGAHSGVRRGPVHDHRRGRPRPAGCWHSASCRSGRGATPAPLSAVLVLGSTMGLMSPITWTHHLVFLSLLLWFPLLSWRERPGISALALAIAMVVLVDPLGAGNADSPLSSLLHALRHARDPGVPRTVARPRSNLRTSDALTVADSR